MISAINESGEEIIFPDNFGGYKYKSTIGKGSIGVVALVVHERTNREYACKIVSRSGLIKSDEFNRFEQELRIQQSLSHNNILRVIEVIYEEDLIFVVTEYCSYGDLLSFMSRYSRASQLSNSMICYQILEGINYMHNRGFSHGDIKPDNILVDSNFVIKIADFGCAESSNFHKQPGLKGTLYYVAPEILNGTVVDRQKSDIWAIGIVLFSIYSSVLPWQGHNDDAIRQEIMESSIKFPLSMPPEIIEVVNMCCKSNPKLRVSAKDLIQLPFLRVDTKKLREIKRLPGSTSNSSINANSSSFNKSSLIIRPNVTKVSKPKSFTPSAGMIQSTKSININRSPMTKEFPI